MKVENMTSPNGNKVANQFLLYEEEGVTFQSYKSGIATILDVTPKILLLYDDMWDYSNTTRKYFKQFINEYTPFNYVDKQQWLKEIKENDLIEVV